MMKYLLRVDLSQLLNIDTNNFKSKNNHFNKREKMILTIIIVVMILMILQATFPQMAIREHKG